MCYTLRVTEPSSTNLVLFPFSFLIPSSIVVDGTLPVVPSAAALIMCLLPLERIAKMTRIKFGQHWNPYLRVALFKCMQDLSLLKPAL